MAAGRDFYDVLGVGRTATADEIQRAYRKLARTYHPDVNKDPGAEDRFKEISEAYDVLSDPGTRRRYDDFGPDFRQVPEGVDAATWARARAGAGARSGGGRRAGPAAGSAGDDSVWFDIGDGDADIDLDDLLGGLFGGRVGRRARGPIPGADQEATLDVTIEDAYQGGRRRIQLGGGDGQRSYDVTIPAGVVDGQRIRLAGQGGRGVDGGPPGDLYLVVRIPPHSRYRLDGRDISVDLRLAPWEAALGTTVPVETPGGEAKIKVPAGTSTGKRLRLRGRGLPNPKGTSGDVYAEIRIMVPSNLTDDERRLFEELAGTSKFDPRRER